MTKPTIRIDRLALEGDGVGQLKSSSSKRGKVAFVPYALPNESVQGQVLFEKKNFARYLPTSIQTPSPNRQQPPCPVYFKPGQKGPWCGGCDWQHIKTDFQRSAKRGLVKETLTRLGGIENPQVNETLSVGDGWRYRNKVQVPFSRLGKKIVAGFYSPGSHQIRPFDDCLIQPDVSVRLVHYLENIANKVGWQAYDEDRHRGWLRHALIRTNERGQVLLTLITTNAHFPGKNEFVKEVRAHFPEIIGIHQNVQKARSHVILGPHWVRLWGENGLQETISGLTLFYAAGSFFQVNTKAAEKLYQKAIDETKSSAKDIVLDLYCGVGALSLLAAKKAEFVLGVEVVPSAIRDAKLNAKTNGIKNVEFIEADAKRVFSRERFSWLKKEANRLIVLVDPPRSGCDEMVIEKILAIRPKRIVYVSCNPATLARDVKRLSSQYKMGPATPVDLFPQTSHIEVVTSLDRISS